MNFYNQEAEAQYHENQASLNRMMANAHTEAILNKIKAKFTHPELNHLLFLIESNEEEKAYYGPEKQYWKRSERIKEKLEAMY